MVLPGTQLFPHAILPLFIFEPRYREMLAWSLEQHRMFCIAPMKPGISEARSPDDFHQVVGLGLVRACVGHEDGTSHLALLGLARVKITGYLQETPFRIAEVRELRSESMEESAGAAAAAKLLERCARLRASGLAVPEDIDRQLAQIDDPEILADIIAHTFLRDAGNRQAVFEELHAGARLRLLIHLLDAETGSEPA